mmetsp:Transcript_12413/g.35524  ORF Transcript_12413/g.35524 Transcript_12413/m.35524 type:complete len:121 (+) Transcript_12413:161-523(+)
MSLAIPFVRRTASTATAGVLRRTAGEQSSLMGMLVPTRWSRSTFGNNSNATAANFWNSGVPAIQVQSGGIASGALVTAPSLASPLENLGIWLTSTLKKRKSKMNKHKLQKRRKKLRLKSK